MWDMLRGKESLKDAVGKSVLLITSMGKYVIRRRYPGSEPETLASEMHSSAFNYYETYIDESSVTGDCEYQVTVEYILSNGETVSASSSWVTRRLSTAGLNALDPIVSGIEQILDGFQVVDNAASSTTALLKKTISDSSISDEIHRIGGEVDKLAELITTLASASLFFVVYRGDYSELLSDFAEIGTTTSFIAGAVVDVESKDISGILSAFGISGGKLK